MLLFCEEFRGSKYLLWQVTIKYVNFDEYNSYNYFRSSYNGWCSTHVMVWLCVVEQIENPPQAWPSHNVTVLFEFLGHSQPFSIIGLNKLFRLQSCLELWESIFSSQFLKFVDGNFYFFEILNSPLFSLKDYMLVLLDTLN